VAIISAGTVTSAEAAAQRKEINYAEMAQTHQFYPLAFKTMSLDLSSSAINFIESLVSLMTRERLHFCFNAFQMPFSFLTQ